MAGSTWNWIGGSGAASSTNWTLIFGPGNTSGHPQLDDTAIVQSGTVVAALDLNLKSNTIEFGGTAGSAAVLTVSGDDFTSLGSPSADATTVIDSAVPGDTTAEISVLDAGGTTVNKGTILADGPAGSTFTIDVEPTMVGIATLPGAFINYGTVASDAGNTLVINVGGTSELLNAGVVMANGGTVVIDAAVDAIGGGYARELGIAAIQNGGTLETNASYTAADGGVTPTFLFLDGTTGDTLKIDDVTQFDGRISGFEAGDTIDLGASLAVGEIVYNSTLSVVYLDNTSGTILASLVLSPIGMTGGTYTVNPATGVAGGLIVFQGADGDTLLEATGSRTTWNDTSGSWQTAGDWSTGSVPGSLSSVAVGLDSTAAFLLTTGSSPATAGFLSLYDPNALVQITSDTTLPLGTAQEYAGTLEVTDGNTLTASLFRSYSASGSLVVDHGGVLDVTGHDNDSIASNGTILAAAGNTVAAQFNGDVLVDGGTIDAGPGNGQDGGFIAIGDDGDSTPAIVTVENGGLVTDTYAYLSSDPTSFGELTLTGAGTEWTDEIDPNDPTNARGDIFIGSNNEATNTSPGVTQVPDAGAAQLTVEDGADLTDTRAFIGYSADSAGMVIVESGGVWNIGLAAGGFIVVGDTGEASLSILAGGTVNVGNYGTFLGGAGGGIGVAEARGASGTITVDGSGALLTTADGLALGKGGQGILSILNGGTVEVTNNGISVGQSAGAGSSGTLSVGDAGALNLNSTGYLTIGSLSGAVGTVVVGGSTASAVINIGTGGITVGNAGTGYLTVNDLGTVSVTNSSKPILVGQSSGAVGTITVDGTSACLAGDGGIDIGWLGQGTMDVQNGASVSTSNLALDGQSFGPLGNLEDVAAISGGGRLQATGGLYIWQGSTVSLDATSGIDVGTSGVYTAGGISVESGHALVGNGLVSATVTNAGLIEASSNAVSNAQGPGTLEIEGAVRGSGVIDIDVSATIRLDQSVSDGQAINFTDGAFGELILNSPGASLGNAIAGVSDGDKIEFGNGMTITGAALLNRSTVAVDFHGSGGTAGTYDLTNVGFAPGASDQFSWGSDALTGDSFIETVLCFLAGTLIATPAGQAPVERLAVGDLVLTAGGQVRPIVWHGVGCILATRGRRSAATPVIVRKGALGPNVPYDDLRVTKGHSFLLDGVLIPVEFLVNHRSILWDDRAQEVSIHHIELESHDVLLANGAAAESYRDDGNRWLFQNANSGWDQTPKPSCAPVLTGGPIVDAVWRRLLDGCGPRPSLPLTGDPDLHLLVNGARVDATTQNEGVSVFNLACKPTEVRITSRSATPQELGVARDPRCLGVAVRRLAVRQGTRFRVIRAGDKLMSDGFHPVEANGGLHWTDGDATFPAALFDGFNGATEVVVHVAAASRYVADGRISSAA